MSEQSDNELICEKLLGWTRDPEWQLPAWKDGKEDRGPTPSFATWAEAGLILDALDVAEPEVILRKFRVNDVNWTARTRTSEGFGSAGPLAIRALALDYLRASEQAAEVGEVQP